MPSKRRILQFTLRTLMLFVLGVASFCAWIRYRSERWQKEVVKLEGKWEAVDWNFAERTPFCVEFHAGAMTWTTGTSRSKSLTYAMPVFADSNELDIIREDGIRLPALFALRGDKLIVIHGQPDTGRPREIDQLNARNSSTNLKMTFRKVRPAGP